MRLGIISDAHHYYDAQNRLCTLTLLARQFEQWAQLFKQVLVCAPLLPGTPPGTHSPYMASNLSLLPIPNAGGNTPGAKLKLLDKTRGWWQTLDKLMHQVDAVHIRCPNNISILGLLALRRTHLPCQAVYTGSWNGYPGESLTYHWQRFYLKAFFRGPVAVYGEWLGQPAHIVPSFSPSYTQADWEMESEQVSTRLERLLHLDRLPEPVQIVSVGALNRNKNQRLAVQAIKILAERGLQSELHLLGDGEQRLVLETMRKELGVEKQVHLHGSQPHDRVRQFYRQADFVLQAPYAEGYGKVPVEAFFHGVVPILSDVDVSSQITGKGSRGRCFPRDVPEAAVQHILELAFRPSEMAKLVENGRQYAQMHTLEAWREHLRAMLSSHWQIDSLL